MVPKKMGTNEFRNTGRWIKGNLEVAFFGHSKDDLNFSLFVFTSFDR